MYAGSDRRSHVADPNKLDIGDWFAAGVAAVIALIGIALPRFLGGLTARRKDVDAKLKTLGEAIGAHDRRLDVLHAEQENVVQQLEDIRENTRQTNAKLDHLIMNLMK